MAARLEVEMHYDAFQLELHRAVHDALEDAGLLALRSAQGAPTDYAIEPILGAVMLSSVERTSKGQGIWLIGRDWRSLFFELGTYKRRRRALKQPRRSTSSSVGVKPAYFLSHAAKVAREAMPELIARHFENRSRLGRE